MRWDREQIEEGLRHAARRDCVKAAVELLIEHGVWIEALILEDREESANYVRQFVRLGEVDGRPYARVSWRAMHEHLQTAGHTYGTTGPKMFGLAASLAAGVPIDMQRLMEGLDVEHTRMVVNAVASAAHPIAWAKTRAVLRDYDTQKSASAWT